MTIGAAEGVYPPSEDTMLLARNVIARKGLFLEVGTGTGFVALQNARANPSNRVLGVDVNPKAVSCAKENAKANGIRNAEFLVSDLFSNVQGKFGTIAFNPPYLGADGDSTALDGNLVDDGVVLRFLQEFPHHLAPGGRMYIVLSDNNPKFADYANMLGGMAGFAAVEKEKHFFEELILFSVGGREGLSSRLSRSLSSRLPSLSGKAPLSLTRYSQPSR
jgi:release factor glutamine methyltransferase